MSLSTDLLAISSKTSSAEKTDGRISNQYGFVFFMNDGTRSTKNKLADHYGIPRSQIQKIYNENNRDYLLANAAIEKLI